MQAATAGSVTCLTGDALTTVLERSRGDHGARSSTTKTDFKAPMYLSSVFSCIWTLSAATSAIIFDLVTGVAVFLAKDVRTADIFSGS